MLVFGFSLTKMVLRGRFLDEIHERLPVEEISLQGANYNTFSPLWLGEKWTHDLTPLLESKIWGISPFLQSLEIYNDVNCIWHAFSSNKSDFLTFNFSHSYGSYSTM